MKLRMFFACGLLMMLIGGWDLEKRNVDEIYQVSTLTALMGGQFDGIVPYARLRALGDFGLGTFDKLDGEMVAVDGEFFQVKSDGKAYPVDQAIKAPFADVTFFKANQAFSLNSVKTYEQLTAYLQEILPDENGYYAIRIDGLFRQVTTRSVRKQGKPYSTLAEAITNQIVFNYEQMEGTMVGTYMPEKEQGIGVAGFHFHFISKDKTKGGHLLDCTTDQVRIAIDYSKGLSLLKNSMLLK